MLLISKEKALTTNNDGKKASLLSVYHAKTWDRKWELKILHQMDLKGWSLPPVPLVWASTFLKCDVVQYGPPMSIFQRFIKYYCSRLHYQYLSTFSRRKEGPNINFSPLKQHCSNHKKCQRRLKLTPWMQILCLTFWDTRPGSQFFTKLCQNSREKGLGSKKPRYYAYSIVQK